MFKEEYTLEVKSPEWEDSFTFTFNTRNVMGLVWNSKTLKLQGYYLNANNLKRFPLLTKLCTKYSSDITMELISDILEVAETLPKYPKYLPPHYTRDTWIKGTLDGALVNEYPFEYITRRLNDLPIRVVVCAANRIADDKKHAGLIIPANRHHSPTMNALYTALGLKGGHDDQGFIDQWGQFMDRKEALKVAMSSGQPFDVERNGCGNPPDELYSEGIC